MDKYGLIGYPLGHSFSISYFNQKFTDENIDAVYENFEIPSIDILPEGTRVLFRTSTSPGYKCWSTSVNTPSVMDPSPRL